MTRSADDLDIETPPIAYTGYTGSDRKDGTLGWLSRWRGRDDDEGRGEEPESDVPPIAYLGYTGSDRGKGLLDRFLAWLTGRDRD